MLVEKGKIDTGKATNYLFKRTDGYLGWKLHASHMKLYTYLFIGLPPSMYSSWAWLGMRFPLLQEERIF